MNYLDDRPIYTLRVIYGLEHKLGFISWRRELAATQWYKRGRLVCQTVSVRRGNTNTPKYFCA